MSELWIVTKLMLRRFAACQRGTASIDFILIAAAMLIAIAVTLDDIGTTLMASRDVASSVL